MQKQKVKLLVEAVVLYVIGEDHTRPMDELSAAAASDTEWNFVRQMLELADEVQVDAGKGTAYQTEKVIKARSVWPGE